MNQRFVIGITGASGGLYARTLLQILFTMPVELHLVISEAGWDVLAHELNLTQQDFEQFIGSLAGVASTEAHINIHDNHDLFAPVASGSFQMSGMIIIPCSMRTLGAIASGCSHDLISRAADVILKEKRPLMLVTRETPLSLIHLKNMKTVAEAGATVMPASPGFYHHPDSIDVMAEHLIARVLDQINIAVPGAARWGDR
ncbi:MAG: UbiX family flavin prenyltransferase [Desulfobacterales bacterium]|nr:UbiX family flavin prenyltransferase [Desulfobacterales bacterium]